MMPADRPINHQGSWTLWGTRKLGLQEGDYIITLDRWCELDMRMSWFVFGVTRNYQAWEINVNPALMGME